MRRKRTALLPQTDFEAAIFFPGGGVECLGWLRVALTESEVGRPLTSAPWSTVGLGQSGKGAASCWDAESGLEVMGRREKEPCLWRGTKWITAIFLLLCLTVRVESGGPDNKGTEPQTQAEWRTKKKLSGRVNIMSFMMIWLNVWWGHSHFSVNVSPDSGAGWWQRLEHLLLFLSSHSSHLV